MGKRLYKVEDGRKLLGVCGGIAEYLNLDPTVVRVVWALFTILVCGTGAIIYIICAFVFPNKSDVINLNDNNNWEWSMSL